MNPHIKKQFILEAWHYNQSLSEPLTISFESPDGYYMKSNWLKFQKNVSIKTHYTENNYIHLVNREMNTEMTQKHARKLTLVGDSDFVYDYFKHFFLQHPDLQLNLIKFFNNFLNYNYKPTEFLKQFDKKEIEPFLLNVNHWLSYSNEQLKILNDFMIDTQFNEGFRVSILKKYVEYNLKAINKNTFFSTGLENFLLENYSTAFDLISTNVVAIEHRLKEVDNDTYFKAFSNKETYCFHETVNTEKLLKAFQIANWNENSYKTLVQIYHQFISEKHDLKIECNVSQNQKNLSIFVVMNENKYSVSDYKNDLLVLFNFYRNNPEQRVLSEQFSQIFLNHNLNENLIPQNKKTKANKI